MQLNNCNLFCMERKKTLQEKHRMLATSIFPLFSQCFQKAFLPRHVLTWNSYLVAFNRTIFINSTKQQSFKLIQIESTCGDKINVTENLKFILVRVENIVGQGENAGYQHFLHSPQCYQTPSYPGTFKVVICGKELNEWVNGCTRIFFLFYIFKNLFLDHSLIII